MRLTARARAGADGGMRAAWGPGAAVTLVGVVRGRPRLFLSLAVGVVAALALPAALRPLVRGLLAWDVGSVALLALCAELFTRERDATMADDAAAQQEGEWTVFAVTVAAVVASMAAVLGEYSAMKGAGQSGRGLHVALVAATLLLSWLVTHTTFALRYAHEYYALSGGRVVVDGGLDFPGAEPPNYWDFFYFALVLGMTFQVSDVRITSRKLRRLATGHGLLSFLFNTTIIALSVNIGASLL